MYKFDVEFASCVLPLLKSSLELSRMFEDSFFVHHLLFVAFESLSTAFRLFHHISNWLLTIGAFQSQANDTSAYQKITKSKWQTSCYLLTSAIEALNQRQLRTNSARGQSRMSSRELWISSFFPNPGVLLLGSIVSAYVPLASKNPEYPIMVHLAANWRPHVGHFWPSEKVSRS